MVNIPYKELLRLDDIQLREKLPIENTVVSVCKMGNDSRLATKFFLNKGYNALNLKGGLDKYSKEHDFNVYW